ncbi:MAG: hypothetical protein C3F17_09705 [Bradyrhizobiaceae bacterium]|nr:MAG: hypothetical protein C3F17_09705 [Bradyrhizobiaceae bacterium]
MRTILTTILTFAAGAALAHPSVVAHEHPHGASLLPEAAALAIGGLLVAGGLALLRRMRRR